MAYFVNIPIKIIHHNWTPSNCQTNIVLNSNQMTSPLFGLFTHGRSIFKNWSSGFFVSRSLTHSLSLLFFNLSRASISKPPIVFVPRNRACYCYPFLCGQVAREVSRQMVRTTVPTGLGKEKKRKKFQYRSASPEFNYLITLVFDFLWL